MIPHGIEEYIYIHGHVMDSFIDRKLTSFWSVYNWLTCFLCPSSPHVDDNVNRTTFMFYNLNSNRYAFSFHMCLVLIPKKREQNKEEEKIEKTEPDDVKKKER